jgi:hypothetical protein
MKLPKITNKQQEILQHLYRYRFLNRIQIQKLMHHKDPKTINMWLKDLRSKNYVAWIYSTHFADKTKPAIYHLSLNGVRYLRRLIDSEGYGLYPDSEIHKRYKEAKRQTDFIHRSILIADCCISLEAKNTNQLHRTCVVEADYIDEDHELNFLEELRPTLYIKKQQKPENSTETATTNFLLTIADSSLPRYRFRKRIKNYLEYMDDDMWEGEDPSPIVLVACATLADMIYGKRLTRKLLEDLYDDGDIDIRFTTIDKIKQHSISGDIWEKL